MNKGTHFSGQQYFFLLKLELNHYFIGTLFSRNSPQFWYTSSKISRSPGV